jgi:preprotein translocase subunit SecG
LIAIERHLKRALGFTAIVFAVIAIANPIAAHAQDTGSVGIRIAEIPSGVADNPLARVYIIDRLQPSVILKQHLQVFNTSKSDISVSLYPGAATFANGEFTALGGRATNDLTKWTTITPDQIRVKSGSSQSVFMTITPPADAPSVQVYGVIWAEVRGATGANGVTSVSRVGIRMYVPVGNSSEEEIGASTVKSSTNEILINTTSYTGITKYIFIMTFILFFVFLVYVIAFIRRWLIARRAKRKKEALEKLQWAAEKRRRTIAARKLKARAKEDLDIDEDEDDD